MNLRNNPIGKDLDYVDFNNGRAIGICDVSLDPFFHDQLVKEMEAMGPEPNELRWTGYMVSPSHLNVPNHALYTKRLGPDPIPVENARPPQANFYTIPPTPLSEEARYQNLLKVNFSHKG